MIVRATINDISRPTGVLHEPAQKTAIITDVTPPGWLELGYEFRYCAQIDVTAADMIVWSPIFTYEIDVSGLTFLDPAFADRRVLYFDGSSFEEIDSDVRDIGMGLRVYFPAQINLAGGASDTTSYWLFWNSTTAVATKTNRDNIYLKWDECNSKVGWTDYEGVWNVVGGRFIAPAGVKPITFRDDEPATNDYTVYGLLNRQGANASRSLFRAEPDAGGAVYKSRGWFTQITATNLLELWRFNTVAAAVVGSVAYVHNGMANYIVKTKIVGNNFDVWASPAGTPITGAPLISVVNATHNTLKGIGWFAWAALNSQYDNLYLLHAVTNDPTLTFAATQNVADIMPKNITGVLHE